MEFSIKNLLKKSLSENFIFCAVEVLFLHFIVKVMCCTKNERLKIQWISQGVFVGFSPWPLVPQFTYLHHCKGADIKKRHNFMME